MVSLCRIHSAQTLASGVRVSLEASQAHYLRHVMRAKTGTKLALFNAHDGEWLAEIDFMDKKTMGLTCLSLRRAPLPSLPLTVCFAPVKGGRTETILEKATELGAAIIQPVRTEFTVLPQLNVERAQLIVREAAEQCERTDLPTILPMRPLHEVLAEWPANQPLIYGDESGAHAPFAAGSVRPAQFGILAGPEGGFSPKEFGLLNACKDARGVSLGPRILRADTAILALATLTTYHWGDWHALRPAFRRA